MQSFLEPSDILRRFVRPAGNRIGIIKQFLGARRMREVLPFGQKAGLMASSVFLVGTRVSGIRGAVVVDNLQYLAFDDSPDPVEVSATLVFEIIGCRGL